MRVIAGKHKSKALESMEGRNTRPTMDKVKEGIFNSLYDVSGIGLDLFAERVHWNRSTLSEVWIRLSLLIRILSL